MVILFYGKKVEKQQQITLYNSIESQLVVHLKYH